MWAVDNQTRFAAERTFVRDRDGAEIWLVAVRATFEISPTGEVKVAEKQDPVALAPQYLGKPGQSSLRCDTDLPRTKQGTDVLLQGTAYAPGGRPAVEVPVTLSVGPIRKMLVVKGDCTWSRGLMGPKPGETQPFVKMPMTYERAYGGAVPENPSRQHLKWADQNPVGVGLDSNEGAPIPNVEYPSMPLASASAGTRPAGFGPVSCAWMPRRKLAGTYDDAWQKERQPLVPLDFRDEYFYSAPTDQQVPGYLRGGDEVELINLTPSGRLRFRLPKISLGFRTWVDNGATHHRGVLHTVLIEPELSRLIMVWHTALPCHHTLYTLNRTVVFEKSRLARPRVGSKQLTAAY
jgi:hypothetical protein